MCLIIDAFQAIPREDYRNNSFTYADGSSSEQKTFSVFQYCNSTCSLEDTQTKLKDHYEAFGATDIEILRTFTFPYFSSWNVTGKFDLDRESTLHLGTIQ